MVPTLNKMSSALMKADAIIGEINRRCKTELRYKNHRLLKLFFVSVLCTGAHMSLVPLASAAALSAAEISANLVNTDFTLPLVSMEIMRQWSSSFTQHKAVLVSLWKIPRSWVNNRKRWLDGYSFREGAWLGERVGMVSNLVRGVRLRIEWRSKGPYLSVAAIREESRACSPISIHFATTGITYLFTYNGV